MGALVLATPIRQDSKPTTVPAIDYPERVDVRPFDLRVLEALAVLSPDEARRCVQAVADRLQARRTNVSDALSNLARLGFVERIFGQHRGAWRIRAEDPMNPRVLAAAKKIAQGRKQSRNNGSTASSRRNKRLLGLYTNWYDSLPLSKRISETPPDRAIGRVKEVGVYLDEHRIPEHLFGAYLRDSHVYRMSIVGTPKSAQSTLGMLTWDGRRRHFAQEHLGELVVDATALARILLEAGLSPDMAEHFALYGLPTKPTDVNYDLAEAIRKVHPNDLPMGWSKIVNAELLAFFDAHESKILRLRDARKVVNSDHDDAMCDAVLAECGARVGNDGMTWKEIVERYPDALERARACRERGILHLDIEGYVRARRWRATPDNHLAIEWARCA